MKTETKRVSMLLKTQAQLVSSDKEMSMKSKKNLTNLKKKTKTQNPKQ